MTTKQNWMGTNGFTWFLGIVQDINDPLNCGRVKIRCIGWHCESISELPVDQLPWAQVLMPVTSASTSSVGRSGTGLLNGSCVMGFFLDGENAQQPVVMGSLHGIPDGSYQGGYSDPDKVYPKYPGFPDTPNLAYDRFIEDNITKNKEKNVVKGVKTAFQTKTWSEPLPRNGKDPVYPKNHVTQTESGHAIEIDDTPGNQRIHIYHKTGSFCEIQNTGDRVTKIVGDDYEICVKDKNVSITGECNVTVTGDARLYFKKDLLQEVGGNYKIKVGKDMSIEVGGTYTLVSDGNMKLKTLANQTVIVSKDQYTSLQGDTHTRKKAGSVDYTCSTDTRTSKNDCTDIT